MKTLTVVLRSIIFGLSFFASFVQAHDGNRPLEYNHTASDVVSAFESLAYQGEWLGFDYDKDNPAADWDLPDHAGLPDAYKNSAYHFQGMARSPRTSQGAVFYATINGKKDSSVDYGALLVVQISNPKNGGRIGSNRLEKGVQTVNTYPLSTEATVVKAYWTRDYEHPGGMAMVGDILAVPDGPRIIPDQPADSDLTEEEWEERWQEKWEQNLNPEETRSDMLPKTLIRFYDCSEPLNPKWLPKATIVLKDATGLGYLGGQGHGSSSVAITKLPDGKFFLAVPSGEGVWFYKSESTSFFLPNGEPAPNFHWGNHQWNFTKQDLKSGLGSCWPFKDGSCDDAEHFLERCDGGENFQSLHFVDEEKWNPVSQEMEYGLFLIGSANSDTWSPLQIRKNVGAAKHSFWGKDRMWLLEVDGNLDDQGISLTCASDSKGIPKQLRSTATGRNSYSWWGSKGIFWVQNIITKRWNGNFNAGAAAYVSPSGELLYYSIFHWADRPKHIGKIAEIRHQEVTHDGTCSDKPKQNHLGGPYSIVQGSSLVLEGRLNIPVWVDMFNHRNFSGYNILMDHSAQEKDDFDDFSKLDGNFKDKMTSYRWCGPEGATLTFFNNPFHDINSEYKTINGSGETVEVANARDINFDETSKNINDKVESVKIDWTPPTLDYTWSHDGGGLLEEIGDDGETAIFTGEEAGSWTVNLTVNGEEVSTTINVINVPPIIKNLEFTPESDQLYEGEITLSGEWEDFEDYCAVTIDWGDGTEIDGEAENSGQFSFSHFYADNGEYTVTVCVDDGSDETNSCPTSEERIINVKNAPPELIGGNLTNELAGEIDDVEFVAMVGLTVNLTAVFNDMGTLDTHEATIDWDDGTIEPGEVTETPFGPPGDPAGLNVTVWSDHVYLVADIYTIMLAVEDDDGGIGQATHEVEVMDATGALEILVDNFLSWLNNTGYSSTHLSKALDKLYGKNGALYNFGKDKPKQALDKIRQALIALEKAEKDDPGIDLTNIKDGVALVAKSQAVMTILAAEAVASQTSDFDKIEEAKELIGKGDWYLKNDGHEKAVEQYRKAFQTVENIVN